MNKTSWIILAILAILLVWNAFERIQTNAYENRCKMEFNKSISMNLKYCTYEKEYCFCEIRKCSWILLMNETALCNLQEVIFKLK